MPQANLVMGLCAQKNLFKRLTLTANYAYSALTQNTQSDASSAPNGLIDALYSTKSTTAFDHAYRTSVSYAFDFLTIGASYNYTGKGFASLGTNFLQTDYSEKLLNCSFSFLKKTGHISGSIGNQLDNLTNTSLSTNSRWISALNYSQTIQDRFNLNLNYSNFSSSNKVVQNILSDSINFYQVTANYGATISYNTAGPNRQSIVFNASYQEADQYNEYGLSNVRTKFMNLTLTHTISFDASATTLNSSLLYNQNSSPGNTSSFYGPSVRVSKSILGKKLKIGNTICFLAYDLNGTSTSLLTKDMLSASYTLYKKHVFGCSIYLLNQASFTKSPSFLESRASFNYNYNFGRNG
jgi:hypothetical protein